MNRKVLAREWLYLVAGLAAGVLGFPLIVFLISGTKELPEGQGLRYMYLHWLGELLGGGDQLFVWAIALLPYSLLQFLRSLIWAIKTLRRSD